MAFNVIDGGFGTPQTTAEDAAAHANTIKFLEETLERAKQEKVVFAQVLMLLPGSAVLDGWSAGGVIRPYIIVGALEDIKLRFREKNIEQR